MRSKLKWTFTIISMTLRQILAYRVDFWTSSSIFIIAQFTLAWALWAAIFESSGKTMIGGYDLPTMAFYFLLANCFSRALIGPPKFIISNEIYQGELTKYLIYPLSYFYFRLIYHLTHSSVFYLLLILGSFLFEFFIGIPKDLTFSFQNIIIGWIVLNLSVILYFLMASCLELMAFWADNVWSLLIMFRWLIFLFGGVYVPLTTFPEWAQSIINLLPFKLLISFPVTLMMGQLNPIQIIEGFMMYGLWMMIFYYLKNIIWEKGSKVYSGVGI